ncbi:MAG: universal stress protein [Halobacteriaceae archaeon]
MIDEVVIATDGSRSVERAIDVALDVSARFDATVHALCVVDIGEIESAPEDLKEEMRSALEERAENATETIARRASNGVITAVREGRPPAEITTYAREVDADIVATGTRGRHGENRFLIGSVAERVVRTCPIPVLTVRHLEG